MVRRRYCRRSPVGNFRRVAETVDGEGALARSGYDAILLDSTSPWRGVVRSGVGPRSVEREVFGSARSTNPELFARVRLQRSTEPVTTTFPLNRADLQRGYRREGGR